MKSYGERMKSYGKTHLQEAGKQTQTHISLLSMFTVVSFMCKPLKQNWTYAQIFLHIDVVKTSDSVTGTVTAMCVRDYSVCWMCCHDEQNKNKGWYRFIHSLQ